MRRVVKKLNRTETAVGSPFFAPEGLLSSIKSVFLVLEETGEKLFAGELHRPRNIHLTSDFTIQSPKLFVELDSEQVSQGVQALGLKVSDIELLVIARNNSLRRAETLFRKRLESGGIHSFEISGLELQKQLVLGRLTRITISVYVVIGRASNSKTFFPPPLGAWIAGNGFAIQPPVETFEFIPDTLDIEAANRLRVPYDSFTYVEFLFDESSEPLTSQVDANYAFRVFVNESVQYALIRSNKLEFRQSLVGSIMTSVVPQLILQLQKELLENETLDWTILLENQTIATRLIESLRGSFSPEQYLDVIRRNPAKAIALADSQLQTAKKILGVEQ
jgi:hypothetical protein